MFLDLYDEETDEPAQCHTSNINEELGLVTHLLTDKTGIDKDRYYTSWENIFLYKKC